MKSWAPVFNQPKDRQAAIYADPAFRNAFREEARGPALAFSGNWERVFVTEAFSPELKRHEGRSIEAIAKELGKDGFDTFLDLTLQDDLKIEFHWKMFNVTESRLPELLNDRRTVLGLSDAGAHVDALCDAGFATYLLGRWVRELEAVTLEHAVHRLTGEPASLLGLAERGRLKPGLAADIAIFDPKTVGSTTICEKRHDLPGGGKRLVVPSKGVEHTIVNGAFAYRDGKLTVARTGQVLRS
jgi:N-acyl-D-aspartate/D-glutamate deacylase